MGVQIPEEEADLPVQSGDGPNEFDINLGERDRNAPAIEKGPEVQKVKVGDDSTKPKPEPKPKPKRIAYDVIQGGGITPLFTKKEALHFCHDKNGKEMRRQVVSTLNCLLCPKADFVKVPFIFVLHFSKESSKRGRIWSDPLFEVVGDIIDAVLEEAKRIGDIEVKVINDDFDAEMVFTHRR